jgi:AcrR family transcriptional regulator
MSSGYESHGRIHQKARTRAAMLAAARELLAMGAAPTVEEAARRAGVARTTAYRYFKNQRALLLAAYPALDMPSLLGDEPPADPAQRLALVIDRFIDGVVAHEPELRVMLRLSLESPRPSPDRLPLRRGRALPWIEDALAPLRGRMSAAALRRLVLAIRATTGIESLVWLCDVAGLSRAEAKALMKGSALALLRAAVADASDGEVSLPSRLARRPGWAEAARVTTSPSSRAGSLRNATRPLLPPRRPR